MTASDAQGITYRANKLLKGIHDIEELITEAANRGHNIISSVVRDEWGYKSKLVDHFKSAGFTVSTSHEQTSPNDGDDYITVSW